MIGDRKVNVFFDDIMLGHDPQVDLPFMPSRVEKRVSAVLKNLDFKWSYPEHPGRLRSIKQYLDENPVPGTCFVSGPSATYEQLSRVHTASYLDHIFLWLASGHGWIEIPQRFLQTAFLRQLQQQVTP